MLSFFASLPVCVKTNCCCVRTLKYFQTKMRVGGPAPLSACLGPMIRTDNLSSILSSQNLRQSSDYLPHSLSCEAISFKLCMLYFGKENTVTSRPEFSYQISSMSPPENSSYTLYSPLSNTKHEYKILHFKRLWLQGLGREYARDVSSVIV